MILLKRIESALLGFPRWLAWTLLCLWIALILALGAQPSSRVGVPRLGFFFNLAHSVLYGLLALWLVLGLHRSEGRWPSPSSARRRCVLLAALTVGLVDEIHQASVPGRDASVLDLVTDLAGASSAWMLICSRTGEGRVSTRLLALAVLSCGLAALLATLLPGWIPSWGWL